MNSEDVSIFSPFLAVFIGCFSAFIFALFIVFCKQYFQQIKKENTLFGFIITTKKRNQRQDSACYENCECCCCCKDNQIPCQCNLNSNNNSNSLSQNDPEIDSNVLIFDRNLEKLNESLLDTISIEKAGFDLSKINFCQNSLDVASLDEIVNEELFNELDKNLAIQLDENDNQSFEILKSNDLNEIKTNETKKLIKQLSLNNDKPLKVILKLHKNLPLKLHSQSIELINEKPSTKAKKLIPLLRRASLNLNSANLVRQKSFDIEEEETSCQELTLVKDKNFTKDSSINNQNYSQNISYNQQDKNKILNDKSVENQDKSNVMTNDKMDEIKEEINQESNEISDQLNKPSNLLSNDINDQNSENDYKCADYKDIWSLRNKLETTLETEVDLDDSYGDLNEILNNANIIKQNSIENNEEHELIKNLANSDQRLSKNDSGYKSIERRDFSIDSKTETIYRQFTGSTSISKESFSLGSISNQNISLSSNNSINLDIKNYKNQFSIREEPETINDSNEKITFV